MARHVRVPGVRVGHVGSFDAAAIATSVERMCRAGLACREPAVLLGERSRLGAFGTHAEDLEVDELTQMAGQEVDVDSGAAVDLGRVLTGQQAHAHGRQPTETLGRPPYRR